MSGSSANNRQELIGMAAVIGLLMAGWLSAGTIVGTDPPDGATAVELGSNILVNFDREMDATTLTESAISVNGQSLAAMGGRVLLPDPEGKQAVLLLKLDPHNAYRITLDTTIRDAQGQALDQSYTWRFATGENRAFDKVAPRVIVHYPRKHQQDIPLDAPITTVWTTRMDPASVTADAVSLKLLDTDEPVALAGVWVQGNRLAIKPAQLLQKETTYEITINTALRSIAGLSNEKPASWRFTTGQSVSLAPYIAEAWSEAFTTAGERYAILHAAVESPGKSKPQSVTATVGEGKAALLELRDSGDMLTDGDAIAGDGLYTARFVFPETAPSGEYPVSFTATVNGKPSATANINMYLIQRPQD